MIFEGRWAVKYNLPCTDCNATEDTENASDCSCWYDNRGSLNVYQRIVFTKPETV